MSQTPRALIAARKSTKVAGREGQSLTTQDQLAREFCERQGWTVVGVARDTISGRVAPVDRRELGAWLAAPEQFDLIVAYRTDRLSRGNQEDWTRVEHWATEHAKTLVMVDAGSGIRYPARDDSDYWQWQATKREAGREWESSRERNIRAQTALVAARAATGRPPYGFALAGERYAKRFEIEPEAAQHVREVFRMVTDGASVRESAAWLSERSGRAWGGDDIARMVKNWTYAGRVERNGQHVADCPEIVTPSELAAAQRAVRSRNKRNAGGRPAVTEPALLVPVCGECRLKMYRQGGRGRYSYYCMGRHGFGVPVEKLDAEVIKRMTSLSAPEILPVLVRGSDHADQIERYRRDRLAALDRDDIDRVALLTAEMKRLEALDVEPDRVELQETGRTYGQVFAAMSRNELRAALRAWTVEAYPSGRLRIIEPKYDV